MPGTPIVGFVGGGTGAATSGGLTRNTARPRAIQGTPRADGRADGPGGPLEGCGRGGGTGRRRAELFSRSCWAQARVGSGLAEAVGCRAGKILSRRGRAKARRCGFWNGRGRGLRARQWQARGRAREATQPVRSNVLVVHLRTAALTGLSRVPSR